MESYSSSCSASSTTTYLSQTMQPTKCSISNSNSTAKKLPYYQSSLHSVRRTSSKPWKKPAVAPLPEGPPRVYKVEPINFRDLVQKLTSAPEFLEPRTLQSVAPAPIDVHRNAFVSNHVVSSPASKVSSPFSVMYKDLADTLELSSTPHHHQKVNE